MGTSGKIGRRGFLLASAAAAVSPALPGVPEAATIPLNAETLEYTVSRVALGYTVTFGRLINENMYAGIFGDAAHG